MNRLSLLSLIIASSLVVSHATYADDLLPELPLPPSKSRTVKVERTSTTTSTKSTSSQSNSNASSDVSESVNITDNIKNKNTIKSLDDVPFEIVDKSVPIAPLSDPTTVQWRTQDGRKVATDLTPAELELIRQKKSAISKYLYEQKELSDLRDMLSEDDRQKNVQQAERTISDLTPEEIIRLRKLSRDVEMSKNKPIQQVENRIKTVPIDLAATRPISLSVVPSFASSLVFYDENGAPWPITGEVIGDSSAFNVTIIGEKKNMAVFSIKRNFSESNALLHLKGLDVTLVIRLIGNDSVNDSRVSVQIPKTSPDYQMVDYSPSSMPTSSTQDDTLLEVANGSIPAGSKRFEMVGVKADVFYKNGYLYIRTRYKLVIPAMPKEAQRTPTGYYVYKLQPTEDFTFLVNNDMQYASIEKSFNVPIKHKSSLFK